MSFNQSLVSFSYFYILKKWLEGSTTKQDLENVERMGMMHG